MVTLVRDIHRLKSELLVAGGATIDTPIQSTEDAVQVAARTVVQPDGDILFFVGDAYLLDPDVRQLHSARVSAWFAGLESIVTTTAVALRGVALLLTVAVVLAVGSQTLRQGIFSGLRALILGLTISLLFEGALRLALGRTFRRHSS